VEMGLEIQEIIRRPIISEKAMAESEKNSAYAFDVDPRATKEEIRRAVEQMFRVKVVSVRTMNRRGKTRRARFRFKKKYPDWKKAVVKLAEGHRIDLI